MKKEKKVPETLEECFEFLERDANKESMQEWANMSEDEAGTAVHHGLGTALRNDWGLWFDTSPLHRYFNTLGINHGDDISGIIFTSFHRKLNNKDIDLEGQLKIYWKHWLGSDFGSKNNLPPQIERTEKKYLELFKKFKKELKNG